MRKLLFITLISIMVISLMSGCGKKDTPASPPFMLKNGDMEEKDPKKEFPMFWGKGGQADKILGDDDKYIYVEATAEQLNHITYITDPEDDNSYIKIGTITKQNNFIYAYQSIENNIPKGKKLKLTVKIKTENLTGGGAALFLRCDDSSGVVQFAATEHSIEIKGTKDWTTYTLELNERVRSDIESIIVFLLFTSDTSGTVYFDDASLTAY